MKFSIRFAWGLGLVAALVGCGGGGGGGAPTATPTQTSPPTTFTTPPSAPSCVTNASKGWLTDYRVNQNNPDLFDQAFSDCVSGTYSAQTQLIAFPNTSITLTGGNIRSLIDDNTPTTTQGNSPVFTFFIDAIPSSLNPTVSRLELAITKGNDSTRDLGESEVRLSIDVRSELENGELVVRSNTQQSVPINAVTSSNAPILFGNSPFQITFNTNDVIARTTTMSGQTAITIYAFGLLTKIYDSAQASDIQAQLLLAGLRSRNYPDPGQYTFSFTQTGLSELPLKTTTREQIKGVSIGLPITN